MALQMGVTGDDPVAGALLHLYSAARRAVLDSVITFDADKLGQVRQDFHRNFRDTARSVNTRWGARGPEPPRRQQKTRGEPTGNRPRNQRFRSDPPRNGGIWHPP
jgi:hypothetical protein